MPLTSDKARLWLFTTNIMLIANAFVWYLLAFNGLQYFLDRINATAQQTLLVYGVNTIAIVISGLIGSILTNRLKTRRRFLYLWIVSGVFLSIMPLGLNATDLSAITIISLAFGLYFGLGMPATMAYHSSFTEISGRAALGGFTFLIIGATFAVVGSLVSYGLTVICLLLLAIRLIGLFVFHSMPQKQEPIKDPVKVQYRGIITQKSFLSYFIPWLMFALINYMTYPVVDRAIGDNFTFLSIAESIIIAVVAVLTGLIADKWGRKRLIIIGFVMIGIGYAVLGLDSHQISVGIYTIGDFGRVVYSIADGIAWGIFFVLFLVTIWGDLAQGRSSDKFYFLGAVPYVSSFFMQFALENALSQISPVTIFSFASVFLFLSVLPLIYAVETLPEKVMKDRDLKSYIENAKKKAAKMTQKKMQSPQEEADEPSENSADYEEAKKLAEKYY